MVGFPQDAVLAEDSGMQEHFCHRQDGFVSDPTTQPVLEGRMVDHVEAGFDVTLQHPLIGAGGELVNLRDHVLGAPSGAETIRRWPEIRLQDRLKHQFSGPLARCGPVRLRLVYHRSEGCGSSSSQGSATSARDRHRR